MLWDVTCKSSNGIGHPNFLIILARLMDSLTVHLRMSERLSEITQRVGYTLWQLQELEGVAATYFVLLAEAKRSMGVQAGEILIAKAKGKTFGETIRQLQKAALLSDELEQRFRALLVERNWLVHSSRADSRAAIYNDSEFGALLFRLDRIAEEALAVLREVGALVEKHVIAHGISRQQIDMQAATLLRKWREGDVT